MKSIIQVGVGSMGAVWTDVVARSSQWQAVAYVDPNRTQMLAVASRHGMSRHRCFASLEDALKKVEADAVLDVTPQRCRKQVVTTAFNHGLPVLAEKPLADTVRNAQTLVRRAEKAGCTFMVAQNYRYQAPVQTVKRFLDKGRLGEPGYAGVTFHTGPHFGGFRETMAYPLVLDMSIHHIDLMRYLLGQDVIAVQATSINAPWNWNKGDATVMAQLLFSRGAVVNYFGSWVAQGAETSWNGHWRIEGTKGVLLWERDTVSFSDHPSRKRAQRLVKCPLIAQDYLLDAFGRALDSGEEPETSGRRNLNSLAATWAVVRAVKEQRRVEVDELLS